MKSGMAMVRISGAKIRSLREEQNLTQLYLATAVGVTTETISRWERTVAPTIKEENGIKLAESLAVNMEDILALDDPVSSEKEKAKEVIVPVQPKNNNTKFILAAILLAGVLVYFLFFFQKDAVINFSAKRLLPAHSVSGTPFPVVIGVKFMSGENSSLLLKEQLPQGCSVLRTVPSATVVSADLIKWIEKKGSGKRSFAYMVKCESKDNNQAMFSFQGSLLVRQSSRRELVINGQSDHQLLNFHWADTNKDNRIDDEELLAVYDDFASIDGLFDDMEEVESIWMGSGYRLNAQKAVFEIIP